MRSPTSMKHTFALLSDGFCCPGSFCGNLRGIREAHPHHGAEQLWQLQRKDGRSDVIVNTCPTPEFQIRGTLGRVDIDLSTLRSEGPWHGA